MQLEDELTRELGAEAGGEESGQFKQAKVENIDVNFIDNTSDVPHRSEARTAMKNMSFCAYASIPSNEKHLKNEGFCVVDNFLGVYSPQIKKLTRDRFISLVRKSMDDEDYDISNGVSPHCLRDVCEELDISHYACDFTNTCFLKYVSASHNTNYTPLVYYAANSHMS